MNWDVSPSFWGMSLFPGLEQKTLGNFLNAFLELELDTFCLDYIEGMSLFLGLEKKDLRKLSRCVSRAGVGHFLSRLHGRQKFDILHIKTLPTIQVSPQ